MVSDEKMDGMSKRIIELEVHLEHSGYSAMGAMK